MFLFFFFFFLNRSFHSRLFDLSPSEKHRWYNSIKRKMFCHSRELKSIARPWHWNKWNSAVYCMMIELTRPVPAVPCWHADLLFDVLVRCTEQDCASHTESGEHRSTDFKHSDIKTVCRQPAASSTYWSAQWKQTAGHFPSVLLAHDVDSAESMWKQ